MKKFLLAAALALPFTSLPISQVRADNCCTPLYRVGISVGLVFRGWCGCDYGTCKVKKGCLACKQYYCSCPAPEGGSSPCCNGGGQAGPWYGAWPYNAHFNAPAPTGFPYWGGGAGYGAGYAAAPMQNTGMYGNAAAVMPPMGSFGGYPVQHNMVQAGYPVQNNMIQAGYYQAPSYWYGR